MKQSELLSAVQVLFKTFLLSSQLNEVFEQNEKSPAHRLLVSLSKLAFIFQSSARDRMANQEDEIASKASNEGIRR